MGLTGAEWPDEVQLEERVLAIESVISSHSPGRVTENLFADLAAFLSMDLLDRSIAVDRLTASLVAVPNRVGIGHYLAFLVATLGWPELIARLEWIRDHAEHHHARKRADVALEALTPGWHGDGYRTFKGDRSSPLVNWTADDELMERLQAIEVISHRHNWVRAPWPGRPHLRLVVIEHLWMDLVRFLESGLVSRDEAVRALVDFVRAEPPRLGAEDAVAYVLAALAWPELIGSIRELSVSLDVRSLTRESAEFALSGADPDWLGLRELRSLPQGRGE